MSKQRMAQSYFRVGDGVIAVVVTEGTNLPDGAEPISKAQYDTHVRQALQRGKRRADEFARTARAERAEQAAALLGVDQDAAAQLLDLLSSSGPVIRLGGRRVQQ